MDAIEISQKALGFPDIPEELIAQSPLEKRDHARLMVLDRASGSFRHAVFHQLEEMIRPGDALVLNDVKVFPARLFGRKETGGQVKVLLLKCLGASESGTENWIALLTPSLPAGKAILFADGISARVEGQEPLGEYRLTFSRSIRNDLARLGKMPLPPYIRRESSDSRYESDEHFYQTVYAAEEKPVVSERSWTPGAVAAPTAGLHFTEAMLNRLRAKGVKVVRITLKVGWGTFRPIRGDDFRQHQMLPEEFTVTDEAAQTMNESRSKNRLWAVGTTVVRTLETLSDENGTIRPGRGETALYIYPGYKFKAVDKLVTNFHLPGHTPLLLAAAFSGTEKLKPAYEEAIREKYRFFSYGDAMAII